MRFPYHYVPVLVAVACLSGCTGGGADQVPVYPVSGQVTMGGNPVPNATVTFSPKSDQPTAIGRTDAEGRYQLRTYAEADGAAAGEYAVIISKAADAPAEEAAHGPDFETPAYPGQKAGSVLPEEYASAATTPLTATVTEGGENNIDFSLEK